MDSSDDETETPGQNTDSVEADVLIETTIENAWALVSGARLVDQ